MEKQSNIFPEVNLFPRLERAGKYLHRLIFNHNIQFPTMLPPETDLKTSEHIRDRQPQLPFEGRLRDYDY